MDPTVPVVTKRNSAYFLQSDVESAAVYRELLTVLKDNHEPAGQVPLCIGVDYGANTVCQHLISIYRKFRLYKNDRELVLNYEDFLVAVQLCLAEKNKQTMGEFDVEVSRVMEVSKRITKHKLSNLNHQNRPALDVDEDFQEILTAYHEFLKNCNVVDTIDVLLKVNEAYTNSEEGLKSEVDSTSLLFQNAPLTSVEEEIVKFLCRNKDVKVANVEYPLDDSLVSGNTEVNIAEATSLRDAYDQCQKARLKSWKSTSVTELYLEQIFNGYLQLLVNSRCEIALSRIINVPERGLDHQAFTDLKRAAKQTGLSLYQTAVSYVMRIRLGGKSYAPNSNNSLAPHVKGMSEFTDMVHKMQAYIEEDPNPRTAVKRVINCIRNSILKHRDNVLRRQSIETVAEKMLSIAATTIDVIEKTVDSSPMRPVGLGGSVLGRKSIKVIREMMDYAAGLPSTSRCVDILSDATSSQKTPLRFPSILSKFKSPLEVEDSPELKKSLAERMRERLSQKEKKFGQIPRFKACMDWAEPSNLLDAAKNEENYTLYECIPSKTLVQPAKNVTARKVLESIKDQENIACEAREINVDGNKETAQEKEIAAASKATVENSNGCNVSRKRKLNPGTQLSDKPTKKFKSENKSKGTKKKAIPLQKGQKQLTAFFRV